MGTSSTTAGLFDKYGPVRLCDTPICERGFVGLGCGAAMAGSRPVIDFMFADFALDAIGEIINQIAKIQYMSSGRIKMPIVLRGCIGIGHSAATHHSGNYYPMFAHFPGLRVVVPSTPRDARGLLKHALRGNDPVIFLEHREILGFKGPVPAADEEIAFGQAAVVREGTDVTVVALALMVHQTLKVCDDLAREGISVELIDPRTVSPLDVETIARSVAKTGRLLIVDEAFAPFGLGAEVAAQLADRGFDDLDAPIRRLSGAGRQRRTALRSKPPSSLIPRPSPRRFATWPRNNAFSSGRPHSMAIDITVPRLGWNMDEGVFVAWLKAEGDFVKAGEPLFSLETDKAVQEVESLDTGTLHILPTGPRPGDTVAVGTVIGRLAQARRKRSRRGSLSRFRPGCAREELSPGHSTATPTKRSPPGSGHRSRDPRREPFDLHPGPGEKLASWVSTGPRSTVRARAAVSANAT